MLIRWEKKSENYPGLLKLACGRLRFRRYHLLTAAQDGYLADAVQASVSELGSMGVDVLVARHVEAIHAAKEATATSPRRVAEAALARSSRPALSDDRRLTRR